MDRASAQTRKHGERRRRPQRQNHRGDARNRPVCLHGPHARRSRTLAERRQGCHSSASGRQERTSARTRRRLGGTGSPHGAGGTCRSQIPLPQCRLQHLQRHQRPPGIRGSASGNRDACSRRLRKGAQMGAGTPGGVSRARGERGENHTRSRKTSARTHGVERRRVHWEAGTLAHRSGERAPQKRRPEGRSPNEGCR